MMAGNGRPSMSFLREYAINDALSPVFLANYGLDINWVAFLG